MRLSGHAMSPLPLSETIFRYGAPTSAQPFCPSTRKTQWEWYT